MIRIAYNTAMTTKQAKANYIEAKAIYTSISKAFNTREARRVNRTEMVKAYEAKTKAATDLVDMGFEKLEKALGKNMNESLNLILSDTETRNNMADLTLKYI